MKLSITVDIDWAPDWAIRALISHLVLRQTPATWFIIHSSEAVDELKDHPELFELGIHPNFLEGSTHGRTPEEVLSHCLELVPNATSMRTHALVQSTYILQSVVDHSPIVRDSSIYLRDLHTDEQTIRTLPLDNGRQLERIPYQWEDDLEFFSPNPFWNGQDFFSRHQDDEYLVIDVHPIHFALNTSSIADYRAIKTIRPDLQNLDLKAIQRMRDLRAPGTMSFTKTLVEAAHSSPSTQLVPICELNSLR